MINLREKNQCQNLNLWSQWVLVSGESKMKLSPQLSLPEAKDCLCKAQYSSCCEWVCILDVCVCACLCVLWTASNLSWITFAVGVYRMVGWHAVSWRGLEITRLAGVWILTVCALCSHPGAFGDFGAFFQSSQLYALFIIWMTDWSAHSCSSSMGLAVSSTVYIVWPLWLYLWL